MQEEPGDFLSLKRDSNTYTTGCFRDLSFSGILAQYLAGPKGPRLAALLDRIKFGLGGVFAPRLGGELTSTTLARSFHTTEIWTMVAATRWCNRPDASDEARLNPLQKK